MKQFFLTGVFVSLFAVSFVLFVVPAFGTFPRFEIGSFSFLQNRAESEQVVQNTTMLITGDVMLARDVENKMNLFSPLYPFLEVKHVFAAHDYVLINFEGSIPRTHVPTPSMTMRFSVSDKNIHSFSELGVTHASLANNHAQDYGNDGYVNTKALLQQHNVSSFGQPYTLATTSVHILETAKKTIAFIGIDLVLSKPTERELQDIFAYATENSDEQYVIVHWGDEYVLFHNAVQEMYAKQFIELGADLVIGHHPHVVQDIQKINDVLVFYSLGNFVFDQYFSKDVQEGMMLSLDIGTSTTISLLPVTTIGSKTQPREMSSFERSEFLESLAKRSDESIKAAILQGEIHF